MTKDNRRYSMPRTAKTRKALVASLAAGAAVALMAGIAWHVQPANDRPVGPGDDTGDDSTSTTRPGPNATTQPYRLGTLDAPAVLAEGLPVRSTTDANQARVIRGLTRPAGAGPAAAKLTVDHPLDGAVFPADIAAGAFIWRDASQEADTWLIDVLLPGRGGRIGILTAGRPGADQGVRKWRPDTSLWQAIKNGSVQAPAAVTIIGFAASDPSRVLSRGRVAISTSKDPLGAPIFFRDVPLPFAEAIKDTRAISWRLGDASSRQSPRTLLTNLNVCGNCHSFTPDGKTLAMDVDYGNDKGSYIITDIARETVLDKSRVITWSDYKREDKEPTFGLLSQISPDGRYVVSTVKDRSIFSPVPDLAYSQRFFPIKGILVVYDRQERKFFSLPGADDPRYVQSNPVWSPDGRSVLFARSESYELKAKLKDPSAALIMRNEAKEFFEGGKKFRYDLYRVGFNAGAGGRAQPLRGASNNGKSNFFPRYSPDGKWIVFCQADSFMLLRPDSILHIMPAEGGKPRAMTCNFPGKMNSWHSFSPNSRWLAFASKATGPYTKIWLSHVDARGNDSPPVLLDWFARPDRAANIPEFVNVRPDEFVAIREAFTNYYSHYLAGLRHVRMAWYARGLPDFREAARRKPDHSPTLYWLAFCLARTGKPTEAIVQLRKNVKLAPGSARDHSLLGALLTRSGPFDEAISHLEAAMKANPRDLSTANNLAWLLATCPDATYRDGARAVILAERVCELTRHNVPGLLDSLAAAYAETGRFDKAVATVLKAIGHARKGKTPTSTMEARLLLYRARRAYHQQRTGP